MKIGWIGLGAMGTPMATRLCDANLDVSVYNRTESKAAYLKEKGVAVYTNPIDLAAKVDLIFIMLSDKTAIDAVLVPEFWEQMSEKIVVNNEHHRSFGKLGFRRNRSKASSNLP